MRRRLFTLAVPAGVALLMLTSAGYLFSRSNYLSSWQAQYPSSTSDNAGCELCHGSSLGILNGYGRAVELNLGAGFPAAFVNIQNLNSDSDSGNSSNIAEINANTQPGWTAGNNTVYEVGSGATSTQQPPAGVGTLDPSAPTPVPEINVTPTALEFGSVTVGTTQSLNVSVQNTGNAVLNVSTVTISGNTDFAIGAATPARPFTVAAGGSATIVVNYTPMAPGDDSGQLTINSNDSNEASVMVALHGTGTPPATVCDINVTPLSLSFGSVQIGQGPSMNVSVGNTGTGVCTVSSLSISPAEFVLGGATPPRPITVQPGASVSVPVEYHPANTGADSGSLQINSNDPDEASVTVSLSGTGIAASVCNLAASPTTLAFGTVAIGSSASMSTQLSNTGTAACTVSGLTVSGAGFALGSGAPSLPAQIAAGGSVNVPVSFAPTTGGARTGSLSVASNDPDTPTIAVTLTGTGQQAATPCDVTVNPTSLNFGQVAQGTASTLSVALNNAGGTSCTVNNLTATGTDFALGSGAPSTPFSIAAGASRQVPVTYTPTTSNPAAGTLAIGSTDPNEPQIQVALTGAGATQPTCNIVVSPLSLNFGGVPLGSSASRSTTVRNTGDGDCGVSSLQITGSEFALDSSVPSLPRTLSAGEALTVEVNYTPADTGDDAGTLTVGTTGSDQPSITVSLAGSGVATQSGCDVQVAPFSLRFGRVRVGSSSNKSVRVVNAGTGTCTLNWQFAESSSSDFTRTSTPPETIGQGQTATIGVRYTPSGTGRDSGALQLMSNDPSEAVVTVSLSGRGFVSRRDSDLEIERFRVSKEVELRPGEEEDREDSVVSIILVIRNRSESDEPREVTVMGVQGGQEVYRESLTVSAPTTNGRRASYTFPPYQPVNVGEIVWSAALSGDISVDRSSAEATTRVKAGKGKSSEPDEDDDDEEDSGSRSARGGSDDDDSGSQSSSRRGG